MGQGVYCGALLSKSVQLLEVMVTLFWQVQKSKYEYLFFYQQINVFLAHVFEIAMPASRFACTEFQYISCGLV